MTGKMIAVANMKGGVGKTTTVVCLAESLAADDASKSVLVVDVDPQASASICLAGDEILNEMIEDGRTLQDLLEQRLVYSNKKTSVSKFIRSHISFTSHLGNQLNISLLPCGPQLRLLEREIIYKLTNNKFGMNAIESRMFKLFREEFVPLTSVFDFIIFDCPPSISPFSEVTIRASDLIIVPTVPDRVSNFGLNAFCDGVWRSKVSTLPQPPKPYVLINRVQNSLKQHKEMIPRIQAEADAVDAAYGLFETRMPQSAPLSNA
jgi:chromosome partitioning protein